EKSGVKNVGTVGRRDENDAFAAFESVHFDENLVERLLALVVSAANAGEPVATDRVQLVDEQQAGRVFLALLKKIAHARGADADKHFDELGAAGRAQRHPGRAG